MKKWLGFVFCLSLTACNNNRVVVDVIDSSEQIDSGYEAPVKPLPKETTIAVDTALPVTYIARGNEPGWIVTIVENKYIKYVGDYGQDSALFPYTKPVFNKRLLFKTYKGNRSLQVEFYKQSCTDDAGRKYPYMVKINVSGSAEYRGCGEKRNTHEK
jgi:uncharacterized membrane protein